MALVHFFSGNREIKSNPQKCLAKAKEKVMQYFHKTGRLSIAEKIKLQFVSIKIWTDLLVVTIGTNWITAIFYFKDRQLAKRNGNAACRHAPQELSPLEN